jgi:hypothetical protein
MLEYLDYDGASRLALQAPEAMQGWTGSPQPVQYLALQRLAQFLQAYQYFYDKNTESVRDTCHGDCDLGRCEHLEALRRALGLRRITRHLGMRCSERCTTHKPSLPEVTLQACDPEWSATVVTIREPQGVYPVQVLRFLRLVAFDLQWCPVTFYLDPLQPTTLRWSQED